MGDARVRGEKPVVIFHRNNHAKIEDERCLGKNGLAALAISLIAFILLAYSICYDCFVATNHTEYGVRILEITKHKKLQGVTKNDFREVRK